MNPEPNKWKIRFGQVFKQLLAESGKHLEDYLFFQESDAIPGSIAEEGFNQIDLNQNRENYNKYFSQGSMTIPSLDKDTSERLDATIVIVPGFGHHLIKHRVFESQIPFLENLGFKVIYANYDDSFESNEKCAQRVYDIVKKESKDNHDLIFLTYSKGSPVVVEMLLDGKFSPVAHKTKAVISFAGALGGSYLAETPSNTVLFKLLKLFSKMSRQSKSRFNLIPKFISCLKHPIFGEWVEILRKANEFRNDLEDLPEGITDLKRVTCENNFENRALSNHIGLFSISAVYPEESFKKGVKFISNPDDLVLYLSGKDMYNYSKFNDTQVALEDSKFHQDLGNVVDLGIVKADHWGITLSQVFSRKHIDPFPRTEMLKAALITVDQYLSQ